jgi:hypothetical protein
VFWFLPVGELSDSTEDTDTRNTRKTGKFQRTGHGQEGVNGLKAFSGIYPILPHIRGEFSIMGEGAKNKSTEGDFRDFQVNFIAMELEQQLRAIIQQRVNALECD